MILLIVFKVFALSGIRKIFAKSIPKTLKNLV